MPLPAAPWLDDFGRDHVNQQLCEGTALGISLEVIGGLVPREVGIQRHRQEEIVAIVDHDEHAARALLGGMVNQVLLGAVRPNVAFERKLTGDDLFDGNLLVPAVATVPLFALWLRHFLRAAQGAARLLGNRLPGHDYENCTTRPWDRTAWQTTDYTDYTDGGAYTDAASAAYTDAAAASAAWTDGATVSAA